MSSAILTSPPTATARLVVDTYEVSLDFKWHPEFAPRYVGIIRGSELVVSFMTVAEMRQGALNAPGDRANATCWQRIWPTSQYSIPTASCVLLGPRFGTIAATALVLLDKLQLVSAPTG